jgi:GntR family transcriptional regulator
MNEKTSLKGPALKKAGNLPKVPSGLIDKESPIPLYYQIRQALIRYIAACEEGDPFPTESQLCDLFSVSRPTVRQAIANLVQEGLVERTAGKGTFVTATRVRRDFSLTFQTFDYEMHSAGRTSDTEVLGFEQLPADELLANQLGIAENNVIYKIRRRRSTNGTSLMTMINYLPADLFPGLETRVQELTALRKTMETVYNLYLVRVNRRLEAVSADSVQAS